MNNVTITLDSNLYDIRSDKNGLLHITPKRASKPKKNVLTKKAAKKAVKRQSVKKSVKKLPAKKSKRKPNGIYKQAILDIGITPFCRDDILSHMLNNDLINVAGKTEKNCVYINLVKLANKNVIIDTGNKLALHKRGKGQTLYKKVQVVKKRKGRRGCDVSRTGAEFTQEQVILSMPSMFTENQINEQFRINGTYRKLPSTTNSAAELIRKLLLLKKLEEVTPGTYKVI